MLTTSPNPWYKVAMNLYLLTQRENTGYDTFDSIVVAAENEGDAVAISPYGDIYGNPGKHSWSSWDHSSSWATKPDNVTCQLIGTAAPGITSGVVISSFNAG